jgi:vitamin K-dependent gamma-carboxylase-like protein
VFRALFAICLAWELPVTRASSVFAIEGGFHLPYVSFIEPISPFLYLGIHDVQWVFVVLLGLGILTRASAGILLVLQGFIFFADRLNFRNHPYFFLLVLLLLTLSPAGRSFSVPALIRRLKRNGRHAASMIGSMAPLTVQRLIQIQVSIVYLYAALHKLTGPYLSGRVLAQILEPEMATGRMSKILGALPGGLAEALRSVLDRPGFWAAAAGITVLLELSLAFALWIPKVRKPAMIFGILFHLGIAIVMRIDTFSAAMIASYLVFLDPETLPRLFVRIGKRLAGPAPAALTVRPTPRPGKGPGKTGTLRR